MREDLAGNSEGGPHSTSGILLPVTEDPERFRIIPDSFYIIPGQTSPAATM